MRFRNEKTEKVCQPNVRCQLLYTIIESQLLLYSNSSKVETLSFLFQNANFDLSQLAHQLNNLPWDFYHNLGIGSNQSIKLNDLCRCIALSFKCDIYKEQEINTIESDLIKIIYLIFYILLIIISFFINFLTSFLLLNEHKTIVNFLTSVFFCFKKKKNNAQKYLSGKKQTQIKYLNSISDVLIMCLLISHWIITICVIPNQAYLFYTNSNILDCKLTEFFKAFSVSLSIYSIVGISLQRFFVIKYSQYSCSIIPGRLVDIFSFISIISFIKSIGTLVKTIFISRSYRRFLITFFLLILMWIVSCLIGLFNMSQYEEILSNLKIYDFFEQNLTCKFPTELKNVAKSCTTIQNTDLLIEKADIIYMLFLLVIPNIIVLISYTWVCYHIWSHGSKLNKASFRFFYRNNTNLNIQQVDVQKINGSFKLDNNNRTILSGNSSSIDGLIEKVEPTNKDTKLDHETFSKIIKSSTTQTIQSYHQFSIKKRNMSVTITTFCMIMCFSLCWAPFFMFPIFYYKIADANTYVNVKVVIHLIGYSSVVWNSIILIIKSKRFKLKVARLIRKLSSCFAKSKSLSSSLEEESKHLKTKDKGILIN